jgi:hypothetical protein
LHAVAAALQVRLDAQAAGALETQAAAPTPPLHFMVVALVVAHWPVWATPPLESFEFVQLPPHVVPLASAAQLPEPSQPPALQSEVLAVQAGSAVPMATGQQVPRWLATLQAWHVPHDAEPQQVLLTQVTPPAQSAVAVHDAPTGRPTHEPPLQMWVPLHELPSVALPVVLQTWVPVAHEYVPTVQTAFEHAAPDVQGLQAPALQTWFVPQVVPFGFMKQAPTCPEMLQAWQAPHDELPQHTPSTQVAPLTQSAVAKQAWPTGRPTQVPVLQIRLPLQRLPSVALPVVLQTCAPVAHEYVPTVQTAFEHAPPAMQAAQAPPLQTMFEPAAPHAVPFGWLKHAPRWPEMLQAWQAAHDGEPQHTPLTQALPAHSIELVQFWPTGRPTQVLVAASHTGLFAGQGFVPVGQQLGSADGMQAVPQAW